MDHNLLLNKKILYASNFLNILESLYASYALNLESEFYWSILRFIWSIYEF